MLEDRAAGGAGPIEPKNGRGTLTYLTRHPRQRLDSGRGLWASGVDGRQSLLKGSRQTGASALSSAEIMRDALGYNAMG